MTCENRYDREGGCAFPFTAHGVGGETTEADPGMTLRDYFAGQALVGLLGAGSDNHSKNAGQFAGLAYALADAMLSAREGKQ